MAYSLLGGIRPGLLALLTTLIACGDASNEATRTTRQELIGPPCTAPGLACPPSVLSQLAGVPAPSWPARAVVSAGNDAALPGSGAVGADGQYHYHLPLDVPPGRMGMAPTLALDYSSGRGNGPLGVGWALSGLSTIAPCPRIHAIDHWAAPLAFDGSDALCLDGVRLVAIGAGQYATEDDAGLVITEVAAGDPGALPSFRVQTRAGVTRTYWPRGDRATGGKSAYWPIALEQDFEGNAVHYAYDDDSSSRQPGLAASVGVLELSIRSISYTHRTRGGRVDSSGLRRVEFGYDEGERPDVVSMRYGPSHDDPRDGRAAHAVDVRSSRRLVEIRMFAPVPGPAGSDVEGTANVWTYHLAYQASPGTSRSLLRSVRKTGYLGGSTLTRTFMYDSTSGLGPSRWRRTGVRAPDDLSLSGPRWSAFGTVDAWADFLHDGRTLLARSDKQGAVTFTRFDEGGTERVELTGLDGGLGFAGAQVVDLDADGLPEIVGGRWIDPDNEGAGVAYGVYTLDAARRSYTWASSGLSMLDPAEHWTFARPNDGHDMRVPAYSPLFFADTGGSGQPKALFERHWAGPAGAVDWACQPVSVLMFLELDRGIQFTVDGCVDYSWAEVPVVGRELSASLPPFYERSEAKPDPDIGPMVPIQGVTYGPSFGARSMTDGSGAVVLFAGVDGRGFTSEDQVIVGKQEPVPLVATTRRNLPVWSLTDGSLDRSAARTARVDAHDDSRLWIELRASSLTQLGDFDGRAVGEAFEFSPDEMPGHDTDRSHWIARTMDYDGDGLADVVAYHVGQGGNGRSGVDAGYLVHWGASGARFVQPLTEVPIVIADMDGDGITDMVGGTPAEIADGRAVFYRGLVTAHDRLLAVGDEGRRDSERVEYVQQPVSAEASGACGAYPVACDPGGMTVVGVRRIREGSSPEAWDEHQYSYGPARHDLRGRGFLGFDWLDDFHAARPEETITYYDTSAPTADGAYQGARPTRVVHTVPSANLPPRSGAAFTVRVTTTITTYETAQTHPGTHAVRPRRGITLDEEYQGHFDATATRKHFGDVPPSAHLLRRRERSSTWDDEGNPTSESSETIGGVSSCTTTTYEPPGAPVSPATGLAVRLASLPRTVTTVSSEAGAERSGARARTVDYAYDDPAHPSRPHTTTNDAASDDPSVPVTTTYTRSADGVVTATATTALTAGAEGLRSETRVETTELDADEGMFVVRATDALGHAMRVLPNHAFGVVEDAFDPNGVEARTTIDDFGRTRSTWSSSSSSSAGAVVRTDYARRLDGEGTNVGTIVSVSGPAMAPTETLLDERGRAVRVGVGDAAGAWDVTTTQYDLLGRVTSTTRPVRSTARPSQDASQDPAHDAAVRGAATTTVYDPLDRVVTTVFPDLSVRRAAYTFETALTTGRVGERTLVTSDLDGRPVAVARDDGTGRQARLALHYGDFGQVTSVTEGGSTATATSTTAYDARGRRVASVDPDGGTTQLRYDGFGEVLTETRAGDAGPATTSFQYDPLGRTTAVTYADGTQALYGYDSAPMGVGKVAWSVSPDGVRVDSGYDAHGRPNYTAWTLPAGVGAEPRFEARTTYDSFGRPATIEYPSGDGGAPRVVVRNDYDASTGGLHAVTEIDGDAPAPLWTVGERNPDGSLAWGVDGAGERVERTYDGSGRIVRMHHTAAPDAQNAGASPSADAMDVTYSYYANGAVYTRTDAVAGRTETYAYDGVHRLTEWKLVEGGGGAAVTHDTRYGYDPLGNLETVAVDGAVVERDAYGGSAAPHRLVTRLVTRTTDAGSDQAAGSFGYDAAGREISSPARASVTYTDFDLPRAVATTGGGGARFLYDANHRRVAKIDAASGDVLVTLGGIFEERSSGGSIESVCYVPGGDGIVAQIDQRAGGRSVSFLHRDALGSVVATSAGSRGSSARRFYDPWGVRLGAAPADARDAHDADDLRLGFAGLPADDDLSLLDMGGRVYDPAERRFLTPDPVVGRPLDPRSYHRYAYRLNDPVDGADPSGFDPPAGADEDPPDAPSTDEPVPVGPCYACISSLTPDESEPQVLPAPGSGAGGGPASFVGAAADNPLVSALSSIDQSLGRAFQWAGLGDYAVLADWFTSDPVGYMQAVTDLMFQDVDSWMGDRFSGWHDVTSSVSQITSDPGFYFALGQTAAEISLLNQALRWNPGPPAELTQPWVPVRVETYRTWTGFLDKPFTKATWVTVHTDEGGLAVGPVTKVTPNDIDRMTRVLVQRGWAPEKMSPMGGVHGEELTGAPRLNDPFDGTHLLGDIATKYGTQPLFDLRNFGSEADLPGIYRFITTTPQGEVCLLWWCNAGKLLPK